MYSPQTQPLPLLPPSTLIAPPSTSHTSTSTTTRHHRRRSSVVIPLDLLRALPSEPPNTQPPVLNHHHRCPGGTLPCNRKCWATLLTSPGYLPGVITLHHSLNKHGTKYPLIVLTTPSLPRESVAVLDALGIEHRTVEPLEPGREVRVLESRWGEAWTKLRVFEMVEFETVGFVDADLLVRGGIDELFEWGVGRDCIAAVHACVCNVEGKEWAPSDCTKQNCAYTPLCHPGALTKPTRVPPAISHLPPICPPPDSSCAAPPRAHTLLNSGLLLLHPSQTLTHQIHSFLAHSPLLPTLLFPDQDLLAHVFRGKWVPLPWVFNALRTHEIRHPELWRGGVGGVGGDKVRAVHFIGGKPWVEGRRIKVREKEGKGGVGVNVNEWWWDEWVEWKGEVEGKLGWVVKEVERWCGEEDT